MSDLTEEEKDQLKNELVHATMNDVLDLIQTRINNFRSICNAELIECAHLLFIIITELTANIYSNTTYSIKYNEKEEFFNDMIEILKSRIKSMLKDKRDKFN